MEHEDPRHAIACRLRTLVARVGHLMAPVLPLLCGLSLHLLESVCHCTTVLRPSRRLFRPTSTAHVFSPTHGHVPSVPPFFRIIAGHVVQVAKATQRVGYMLPDGVAGRRCLADGPGEHGFGPSLARGGGWVPRSRCGGERPNSTRCFPPSIDAGPFSHRVSTTESVTAAVTCQAGRPGRMLPLSAPLMAWPLSLDVAAAPRTLDAWPASDRLRPIVHLYFRLQTRRLLSDD